MNITFETYYIPQLDKKRLRLKKYDSMNSLFLGNFLLEVSNRWVNSFKEWALDPKQICNSSNEIYLDKEDEYIYVCDLFTDDPRQGPCYKISIPDFVELLEQWQKALDLKPDVITITKENGKLVVTAKHSE